MIYYLINTLLMTRINFLIVSVRFKEQNEDIYVK